MPKLEPPADTRSSRPLLSLPRFQFSLAWLMIVVTIVAVILGLGASLGSVFGVAVYVMYLIVRCVVPTPLVICAIFGRGHVRAFAIGALMPWVMVIPWESNQGSLIALVISLICSAACGFLAVATWRWLRRFEE
jgi:hypothetical protein